MACFFCYFLVLSMAMLPHRTVVAMTNNNVPALHVVSLPWNVYEAGCNRFEIEGNDRKFEYRSES